MSIDPTLSLDHEQLVPAISRQRINHAIKSAKSSDAAFIGQERAKKALTFGLGIRSPGYNLYVMGESSTGRYTLVKDYVQQQVPRHDTPDTWVYVNNFDNVREPYVLKLVPGEGKAFHKEMESLVDELLDTFPAAFENPSFQRKKAAIDRSFNEKYEKAIAEVEKRALKENVVLYEEAGTISFSPVINGKPLDDSEFAALPEEQRLFFYELIGELEDYLNEQLLELPQWKRESSEGIRTLKRETIANGIKPLLKKLEHTYSSQLGILKFVRQMKSHLIDTLVELISEESKEEKGDELDLKAILNEQYLPNVFIEHPLDSGSPVVYEGNPNYQNIFGKVEYSNVQGSIYTSYGMIQAGALHKANGGYLLLDADKLMRQPQVWESLKLALQSKELRFESLQSDSSMVNSITMDPQHIPLDVKIILLGSRELYYLMQEYDDEFKEMFRVLVDFDHEISVTPQTLTDFVSKLLGHMANSEIKEISNSALARLVEFSLRQAQHQDKLSAHFAHVIELVHEAEYFALQAEDEQIDVHHIEEALSAKQARTGRISEGLLSDIEEGQILIDTDGTAIGRVNGLTVLEIGDTVFGTPARISATVYAGSNGVVDIEREVDLGKSIHSKGVLLLTGYLGNRFAQEFPLTISANIAVEQNYGHIDGDSASLAELCALISALTNVPVDQSLAMTGSINQSGEVQSIGGVNEKIEGYFNLCKSRGLTGKQGVIIPDSNRINLVLSKSVVQAVRHGKFSIYAVKTVDQALEILTGKSAGTLNSKGNYTKGSINYLAVNRLRTISNIVNGTEE